MDFAKAEEKITNLQKVVKGIEESDNGRIVSQEAYDMIASAAPDLANDFVKNLDDEWVYVGGKMEDLVEALNNNTKALM